MLTETWRVASVIIVLLWMAQGSLGNPQSGSASIWGSWRAPASLRNGQETPTPSASPFPDPLKLWKGGDFKFLGYGVKYKTILFIKVQIYEVALYVEEEGARAEFRRLEKEGFFKDQDPDTFCRALVTGRFRKLLQIRLLRSVSPSQLTGEIGRDLQPRLQQGGNQALWDQFVAYVDTKTISNGASFLALLEGDGSGEGGLYPPEISDFRSVKVEIRYANPAFGEALLDMYLGSGDLVPDARAKWAHAAKDLLASTSQQ